MRDVVARFVDIEKVALVLDVGSFDVNGSYRDVFDSKSIRYVGLDVGMGPGVDVVLDSPYEFPFETDSVDLVVSGQAFEHIEFFWETWLEIQRVLRVGGVAILIAPSRGPEHRYPTDCWRFYPDGFRALARYSESELLEISTDWLPSEDTDSSQWGDTVGVFRKVVPYSNLLRVQDRNTMEARATAAEQQLRLVYQSATWRIGRAMVAPVRSTRALRTKLRGNR